MLEPHDIVVSRRAFRARPFFVLIHMHKSGNVLSMSFLFILIQKSINPIISIDSRNTQIPSGLDGFAYPCIDKFLHKLINPFINEAMNQLMH